MMNAVEVLMSSNREMYFLDDICIIVSIQSIFPRWGEFVSRSKTVLRKIGEYLFSKSKSGGWSAVDEEIL